MISIFYGTRPEYIKLIPLYKKAKENGLSVELVRINQHTTLISGCHFDREIDVKDTPENRLNSIISSCLVSDVFGPSTSLVIVQGDTATAFGIALAAYNRKIKIAHIEAGLRTYDRENPFPEETYRRAISLMASYHFCVSENGMSNLKTENIEGEKFVVGNTCLDNLLHKLSDIKYEDKVLVTLHRRENLNIMEEWLDEIEKCALKYQNLKFIFPVHPNMKNSPIVKNRSNLNITDPLNHEDLIDVLTKCKFVITDSGGIQEESSFLGKKSIVCRKTTERQEGLGVFSILCKEPQDLSGIVSKIIHNYKTDNVCPYGDGHSSEKILKKILNHD
jgi:UDP-N-acetylglucosamine 2-epimerase (non-hydrolysing)